jgi:ElaB/YqjD/DUF883 family membrane-anchored ribosome-binding protein
MHNVAPNSSPDLDRAFGGMAEKAGSIAEQQVAPALVRAAERGGALLDRGAHAVHDAQQHLRDSALRASDRTVGYVRQQPVKALLVAAAGGALLMALASLAARRHHA